MQRVTGIEVNKNRTIILEECPLMAVMGTPADGCDITPLLPFKKRIPDAPPNVKEVQEGGGMETDQGRDGGPGLCGVMALFLCMVRLGSARLVMARLDSGRFAFPLQFSTALEWVGLFTCRYSCAASTAVTSW